MRIIVTVYYHTETKKRKSNVTKNELIQKMLSACDRNQLKYRYVLADNWCSSSYNMRFILLDLDRHIIFMLKNNCTVALSMENKKAGFFVRVDSLNYLERYPLSVWIKGINFPVILHHQVFTHKDGSISVFHLAYSDLHCIFSDIEIIYKKK